MFVDGDAPEAVVRCRQASRLAAGALLLHGAAAPAVRKEAVDLQKMIQAAGGDAFLAEAAQAHPVSPALATAARMPPVLLWAGRHTAVQSGPPLSLSFAHLLSCSLTQGCCS